MNNLPKRTLRHVALNGQLVKMEASISFTTLGYQWLLYSGEGPTAISSHEGFKSRAAALRALKDVTARGFTSYPGVGFLVNDAAKAA